MKPVGSRAPLKYRRVGRAEAGVLSRIPLDAAAVARFLGPLDLVERIVRRGAAHVLVLAEREGRPVGFYVTHPDPDDGSTWWLGYLAVSVEVQGGGIGRLLLARALRALSVTPRCRRVLLLVHRDNAAARHLYLRMGFRPAGEEDHEEEEVLAWHVPSPPLAFVHLVGTGLPVVRRRRLRVRTNPGPHAARMIGLTRGPPGAARQTCFTPTESAA